MHGDHGEIKRAHLAINHKSATQAVYANDIFGHFLKHKDLKDLEERIQRVEERLDTRG